MVTKELVDMHSTLFMVFFFLFRVSILYSLFSLFFICSIGLALSFVKYHR